MKRILLYALLVVPLISFTHTDNNSHIFLLESICKVESNCDSYAIGAYQIWENYWQDACTFRDNDDLQLSDGYESCYDKEYSEKVVLAYWNRYATMKRLGRTPTDEDRARIHNGGPNGYKKDSTLKYWKKVQNEM